MRENIEVEIRVRPIIELPEWIAAARACVQQGDTDNDSDSDNDVIAWYIEEVWRGLPMDTGRSPRENMLSYNVMFVRDLPCSYR